MTTRDFEQFCFVSGSVSRETFEHLLAFESLFRKWAARINLVAPSTLIDLWTRHILDSAQLPRLKPNAQRWLDLGSGGGFPGAIIAILLKERPGASIDLVESNSKKAAFLRSALAEFAAPARVHVERIEAMPGRVLSPEVVTARALAPLGRLLALCEPWLAAGASGLFHKGREYMSEVEESAAEWRYDLVKHTSLIDARSVILEVSGLRRR